MKFSTMLFAVAAFLTSVVAQSARIGYPSDGMTFDAGESITVEVDRPDTLTGSTEVAVVIAAASCATVACLTPADVMGSILYNGPYNPQFQSGATSLPPHENFTVTIPSTFGSGPAQINVAHFSLVGAGPYPFLETMNVTITIS